MDQIKSLKFCRIKRGEKAPFEKEWQNKPYNYDEIKKFIPEENYGVLCGYGGLIIIDSDTPELQEKVMSKLPQTFRVMTGSGGFHNYFFCPRVDKKIVLTRDKHYGEVQSWGSQCVGPGSLHPNGQTYQKVSDSEIAEITRNQLINCISEFKKEEIKINVEKKDKKNKWLEEFIKEIVKKWKEGDRQELALSTAGYLRKQKRLGANSIIQVISEICDRTEDKEKEMRIRAVIETFKKDENEVKGSSGLKERGVEDRMILMSKFSPVPFAESLMRKHKIIYDKNKVLWKYDDEKGLWIGNAEQSLRNYLRLYLMGAEQQKKNYIEEVISYIKDVNYKEDFELKQNPYVVAFKNKVYDMEIGIFRDFLEEDYLTSKLNIDLDENFKDCPKIDSFFEECVGKEYKSMLYDLFAYTLVSGMTPYQKLFFIYGPAGTGKSAFMNLLEEFLGKDNYCSVEPSSLSQDQYATNQMLFKKANIVSDIRYDDLQDVTQIKKLTGEDTIKIREMYKNPYNTKLFVKQIFSTNKLPAVKEKTKAWYRRLYLIQFSNIITQDKRNPHIIKELSVEEELKGLAFKCVERLKRLHKRNFIFEIDIDEEIIPEIYEELSNPVLMFINENCLVERDSYCYKWEFEERLNNWLRSNHFPPQTKSQINQYMKEKYSESNRPYFDKTYRVWVGLRWKNTKERASLNHFNHFNGKIKKAYIWEGSFKTSLNS